MLVRDRIDRFVAPSTQPGCARFHDQLAEKIAILVRLEQVFAVWVIVDEVIGDFAEIARSCRIRPERRG